MNYRILIVDDSKLARMAVAKALSAVCPAWTRVEASNAEEALNLVKGDGVDLAMLDFNMPGRDGLDLAAELRSIDSDIPLAVISANHQVEIVNRAHELGATFLSKPLTEQALREFVTAATKKLDANQ